MKRIEIRRSKDLQFYFVVITSNNKILATSETYTFKQACKRGIRSLTYFYNTATVFGDTFKIIDTTKPVKNETV